MERILFKIYMLMGVNDNRFLLNKEEKAGAAVDSADNQGYNHYSSHLHYPARRILWNGGIIMGGQ